MAAVSLQLPTEKAVGELEPVAYFNGPMPTGVTVSHTGRIFVNFPKWGDDVEFTVAEVRDGQTVPYPNQEINQTNMQDQASTLVSVQSVVVDPADRLWILDTGSIMFQPTEFGGPKLVCVDLASDRIVRPSFSRKTWPSNQLRQRCSLRLATGARRDGLRYRLVAKRPERHHRRRSRHRRELAPPTRPSLDQA